VKEAESNQDVLESGAIRMKVIGVGGAGSNMVDRLMLSSFAGVALAAVNTDQQALAASPIPEKLCIGRSVTGGLGAGGEVDIGKESAEASSEELAAMVEGVDLLFLAAGLGGGTGTGAAPVLAQAALSQGAVVIAFVALPFTIERSAKAATAQDGLKRLRECCNAVVPLPNDLLIQESDKDASLLDAFSKADQWIEKAIRSISAMMSKTGLMNLDFGKLRQMLAKRSGKTLFGLGQGRGADAAVAAVEDLRLCPLLHTPEFSKKADQLLVNIVGGTNIGMADTQRIMDAVAEEFGADADVTMGAVVDEELGDSVEICILGTSEVSNVQLSKKPRPARRKAIEPDPATADEPIAAPQERGSFAEKRRGKRPVTHQSSQPVQQHEFAFSEGVPKGEFENLDGTYFEGQDLDSPTYLRKGVKIML